MKHTTSNPLMLLLKLLCATVCITLVLGAEMLRAAANALSTLLSIYVAYVNVVMAPLTTLNMLRPSIEEMLAAGVASKETVQ